MIIYDYANTAVEIQLPNKEIQLICVNVLSGDETGCVKFTDGDELYFDASDCRIMTFYDGRYIVGGDDIEKWLNFKPTPGRTASYQRQALFDEEE